MAITKAKIESWATKTIDTGVLEVYAKRKELKFAFHAKKRMMERRITEEQIINVFEKPDLETQARTKGCHRAERKLGARTFGIVYQESKDIIKIITVW